MPDLTKMKKPRTELFKAQISKIMANITINREYDVPYGAGGNADNSVLYIDRDRPQTLKNSKGQDVNVDQIALLHEIYESVIRSTLKIPYDVGHELALFEERRAAEDAGLNWDDYNEFVYKHVKPSNSDLIRVCPPDLEIQVYIDWGDIDIAERIRQSQKPMEKPTQDTLLPKPATESRPASLKW